MLLLSPTLPALSMALPHIPGFRSAFYFMGSSLLPGSWSYLMSMIHSHSLWLHQSAKHPQRLYCETPTLGWGRRPGQHREMRYGHLTEACPEGRRTTWCMSSPGTGVWHWSMQGITRGKEGKQWCTFGSFSTSYKDCKETTSPRNKRYHSRR